MYPIDDVIFNDFLTNSLSLFVWNQTFYRFMNQHNDASIVKPIIGRVLRNLVSIVFLFKKGFVFVKSYTIIVLLLYENVIDPDEEVLFDDERRKEKQ